MEIQTLQFGLMMSIIPFTVIFLFLTIAWALMDMSLRKLSGSRRAIWSMVVILFPLGGVLLYNFRVRRLQLAS